MTAAYRDTAILGAGPAGLAVALALTGRGCVRLITPTVPAPTDAARVDMVPAAFLAFLLELGVHPSQIGVRDLHDVRYVAWSDPRPETVRGAAMAHVERPALDLALLAAAERVSGVQILQASASDPTEVAARVIDATGRRAVSAGQLTGLADPWIARLFSLRGEFCNAAQAFRMAVLPDGYVYRLASPRLLAVGVVLSRNAGRLTPHGIETYICDAGAGWVIGDLPPLDAMQAGRGGVASVQWSAGTGSIFRVGDASLARDSLSAQGLCAGLSDAAALVRSEAGAEHWANRQHDQLTRHLRYLGTTITRSRFRDEQSWASYERFVGQVVSARMSRDPRTGGET
jgi:hypothetical protein